MQGHSYWQDPYPDKPFHRRTRSKFLLLLFPPPASSVLVFFFIGCPFWSVPFMYNLIPPSLWGFLHTPSLHLCSMWDLRFLQQFCWRFSSVMLRCVVGTVVCKISKDHSSFLFMVRQSGSTHHPRRHASYAACSSVFSFLVLISYVGCYKGHQSDLWLAPPYLPMSTIAHHTVFSNQCLHMIFKGACLLCLVGTETFVNGCCNAHHHRIDMPHCAWKEYKSYSHVGQK